MLKIQARETAEVEHVQPYIRDVFWPSLLPFSRYADRLHLMNEYAHETIIQTEDIKVVSSGKTDHVVYINSCEAHVENIEDKSFLEHWQMKYLFQLKSQMINALDGLESGFAIVPIV